MAHAAPCSSTSVANLLLTVAFATFARRIRWVHMPFGAAGAGGSSGAANPDLSSRRLRSPEASRSGVMDRRARSFVVPARA